MANQVCIDNVSVIKKCPPVSGPDGPELITNGDFSAPNAGEWILTGSATLSNPFAPNQLAFGRDPGTAQQDAIFSNGKSYGVSIDVTNTFNNITATSIYSGSAKDELIGVIPANPDVTTYTFVFDATSVTSDGALFIDKGQDIADEGFTPYLALDNISVKEYIATAPPKISCRADISYWNPPDGLPVLYQWKSKEFQTANPVNFGAYRCYWEGGRLIPNLESLQVYLDFNQARMAYPLHPLNWAAVGSSRSIDTIQTPLAQTRLPVAGSPLYNIRLFSSVDVFATVKVYGNGKLRYTYTMPDTEPHRLPVGYKAERWTVEIEGTANISNFKMAETGKELKTV